MHTDVRLGLVAVFVSAGCVTQVSAQARPYAGAVAGLATLSADARAQPIAQGLSVALYKPENGPALNLFAGVYLTPYVALQANYVWNRNALTLDAAASGSEAFYEDRRASSQHAAIVDLLIYFRRLDSRVRPYLSGGSGFVRFSSVDRGTPTRRVAIAGPPRRLASTRLALRVAVGMDVALAAHVAFRYSFSETIRHNDISAALSPAGRRGLANFQNLFGIVVPF